MHCVNRDNKEKCQTVARTGCGIDLDTPFHAANRVSWHAALAVISAAAFTAFLLLRRAAVLIIILMIFSGDWHGFSGPELVPIPRPSAARTQPPPTHSPPATPHIPSPREQAEEAFNSAKGKSAEMPKEALREALTARNLYPMKKIDVFIRECQSAIIAKYDVVQYPGENGTEISPREFIANNSKEYFILSYILLPANPKDDPVFRILIGTYVNQPNHTRLVTLRGGSEQYEFIVDPADLVITSQNYGDFESLDMELDTIARKKIRSILQSSAVRLELSGDQYYDFLLTDDRVRDLIMMLDCYDDMMPD